HRHVRQADARGVRGPLARHGRLRADAEARRREARPHVRRGGPRDARHRAGAGRLVRVGDLRRRATRDLDLAAVPAALVRVLRLGRLDEPAAVRIVDVVVALRPDRAAYDGLIAAAAAWTAARILRQIPFSASTSP